METPDRFDPLLVCLHDSLKAYSGAKTSGPIEHKGSFEHLVHSIMAILDANLSENEKILTADVLIALIRQAERDLRSNLSERLALRENLPDSLLHYLAYGEIDIAEAVLLYSPLLSETDLLYVAQSKGKEHWRAIARRADIPTSVTKSLSVKEDVQTHLNLLYNASIDVEPSALKAMTPSVRESNEFAEELVSYKGLSKSVAVSIYWHVSVALRHVVAQKFAIKDQDLDKALEDSVQDFSDTAEHLKNYEPSSLMKEVAGQYKAQNRITDDLLIQVLRRRQGRFFIALFESRSQLSPTTIYEMMKQKGGQGLAVSARALKISKENFVSLFLLSRTIMAPSDIVEAAEMKMAMRYYDSLTYKMAKDILSGSIAR